MFQPALTMNTVLACVDAHGHPSAVCDGATWVAHRLHAPLNFLQVVDESEAHTGETHFSDLTGYDASPTRTQTLDAMPGSHIIGGQSHSQQLLEGVRARALHLGHSMVELSLRQGKLTDALLDLSAATRMVVMGLAAQRLADAGFSTHIVIESGDVAQVLGRHLTIQQLPLLVMSAFTHKGWRQKLLGTTTSTLLRRIPTSVRVLR